jgi:hypothetical protein
MERSARAGRGRWSWLAALILTGAAGACQSAAGPPEVSSNQLVQAELTRTFPLAPGQLARIGPEGPYLGFRRVVSDSRCPLDAVCVWMGDAVVQVEFGLTLSNWTSGELHTDPARPPLEVGDYRVRLTELQPYPAASQPTRADRYRATLVVERR